jgi:hypothetical protein
MANPYGAGRWMRTFLFAVMDRDNIASGELAAFKKLAKAYATTTDTTFAAAMKTKDLMEIRHDCKDK